MKFGVRECADVVFRAKSYTEIGNKTFFKDEPVIYFDTLKTSSLEGAATTVYATGGKGNPRLMAWDGERTMTFTMEDALISPEGLSILTGAGLIEATAGDPIVVHATTELAYDDFKDAITVSAGAFSMTDLDVADLKIAMDGAKPRNGCYVMLKDGNGEIIAEPFSSNATGSQGLVSIVSNKLSVSESTVIPGLGTDLSDYTLFIDYYTEKTNAIQIDIEPDKFGSNFYVEAETLFRDQATGADYPAEFIIPNAKVQSNFTFTMAGSGDPSTFTFTMDAFPGRVKGSAKDVLAAIQIIRETDDGTDMDADRDITIHARG